jgi:hypothetical protein
VDEFYNSSLRNYDIDSNLPIDSSGNLLNDSSDPNTIIALLTALQRRRYN